MIAAGAEAAVRALAGQSIDELRASWRSLGGAPPRLQSAELLRRLLAERIQIQAFGGDKEIDKRIAALMTAHRNGRALAPARARFKPGTLLVREHGGVSHRVEVLDKGFRWQGETFSNLSEIARRITGTRWNGPAFFGLRGAKA